MNIDEVVVILNATQEANEEKNMSFHDHAEGMTMEQHIENQRKELHYLNKALFSERREKEKLVEDYELTKKKLASCLSKISELQLGIGNSKEYTEFNRLKEDNARLQQNINDLNEEIEALKCLLSKKDGEIENVKRAHKQDNTTRDAVILRISRRYNASRVILNRVLSSLRRSEQEILKFNPNDFDEKEDP